MTRLRRTSSGSAAVPLVLLSLVLSACGGGSGGASAPPPDPNAPQQLAYAMPTYTVRTDEDAPVNAASWVGGDPTTFTCTPDLPAGLVMDPATGAISGHPTAPAPQQLHVVRASNEFGLDEASVRIEIKWAEHKSIAPKTNPTDDDLRHFLDRTHFGFSDASYTLLKAQGLSTYVNSMTALPSQTEVEQQARAWLVDEDDPNGLFPSHADMVNWWIHLLIANPNPFQEILALHWHDHFAVSSSILEGSNQFYMVNHVNLLRTMGAGNLRTFLTALARDWAMLEWLDGVRNNGGAGHQPNENFAREWFELFCFGVDNGYTQQDIVEAARAFSGYRTRYNNETGQSYIEFSRTRHDPNDKTVLGVLIPGQSEHDDYEAMTDITLGAIDPVHGHSRCARWIVRSTLRRFVMDDPPEELVNQLAGLLESNGWELRPMLRALFKSEAFFSSQAKSGFVKTPMEHLIGFQRTTTLYGNPNEVRRRTELLGNWPTQPPTVDGWPEDAAWLSAQALIERANTIKYFIRDAKSLQTELGIEVEDLLPPGLPTSLQVVDALALRMRLDLSTAERDQLALYLDTDRLSNGTIIDSPFDATNATHIDRRVRGLLYMMGLHPSYLTR